MSARHPVLFMICLLGKRVADVSVVESGFNPAAS
jgi:hypothetical protein